MQSPLQHGCPTLQAAPSGTQQMSLQVASPAVKPQHDAVTPQPTPPLPQMGRASRHCRALLQSSRQLVSANITKKAARVSGSLASRRAAVLAAQSG